MKSQPQWLPTNAREFEEVCAEWMRWFGFWDATRTPMGADGGIDIAAWNAVAQAKFWSRQVSPATVRDLNGVRAAQNVQYALVFANHPGFSKKAREFALRTGVDLFVFEPITRSFHGLTPRAREWCQGRKVR